MSAAERFAAIAARCADESGIESVTPTVLAKSAGVTTPAIYKHFADADHIAAAVQRLALRSVVPTVAHTTVGLSSDAAIRSFANTLRSWAAEHPGQYAALQRAPREWDAESRALSEDLVAVVGAAIRGYGLPDDDAVDAVRMLRAALHGFIDLERQGGFGLPRDIDTSFARMVDALCASLSRWAANSN